LDDKWQQNLEVRQLAYDGREFRVVRTELKAVTAPLKAPGSDWAMVAPGLTQAIPDGDDLLYPLMARTSEGSACGVTRWQRRYGLWRPTSFVPIMDTLEGQWYEPSLIRDTDGSLLFSARIDEAMIRVWRSTDGGRAWDLIVDVAGERQPAPVTLNRAADGTPYIAGNLLGRGREVVCLWPLSAARSGLESPIVARDAQAEFGPPASGARWKVDHPNAKTLRLADGKWHNVLVYRIMDAAEHGGADAPPQTGCYVEEVLSAGPAIPAWKFD